MLDQFDRLRKRNAFMDVYKREKLFENGLEEFDDARHVMFSSSLTYNLIAVTQGNLRRITEGIQSMRESRLYILCEL